MPSSCPVSGRAALVIEACWKIMLDRITSGLSAFLYSRAGDIESQDTTTSTRVAVVNEAMAKHCSSPGKIRSGANS